MIRYSDFKNFAFQSTPSAWRETAQFRIIEGDHKISIHSLRMEGDIVLYIKLLPEIISIHSLRMEGDNLFMGIIKAIPHFNPLPPHGGRPVNGTAGNHRLYFNPLPPHGGRLDMFQSRHDVPEISIHSLRMEGDVLILRRIFAASVFQSTPSAWRETLLIEFRGQWRRISIHSLRMEGDSKTAQESVFHFAYPCTILQKRMQKTTFCTRKNGFFRKKGEKFGAKPSASFCAPMIRTDTFPLNFSHRISGSSMSMVSFAPICSTFD